MSLPSLVHVPFWPYFPWGMSSPLPSWRHVCAQFHPVGQGLFYSFHLHGQRNGNPADFHMVYDCGAQEVGKSYSAFLESSIQAYARCPSYYSPHPLGMPKGGIDLLVISHLDRDHVNGISKLLKACGGAKHIVLPYYGPFMQMMLLAHAKLQKKWHPEDPDQWYFEMCINPVKYLRGLEVPIGEISFIEAHDPNRKNPSQNEGVSLEQDDVYWREGSARPWNGEQLQSTIPSQHPLSEKNYVRGSASSFSSLGWRFDFFYNNKLLTSSERNTLNASILALGTDMEQVAKNKMTRLCKIYKDFFGPKSKAAIRCGNPPSGIMNEISMVCCHGPDFGNPRPHRVMGGWQMLTGDFRPHKKSLTTMLRRFKACRGDVDLLQVPHHGSSLDWSLAYIRKLRQCKAAVFSYGDGNGHGHPGKTVEKDICSAKWQQAHCTQNQGVYVG